MGKCCKSKETVKNRFKFNGQQLDPITQQYYLRARFYNPIVARFTQEDIYRGDGLNLYSYCANNPVYYIDPSGNNCKNSNEYHNIREYNKNIITNNQGNKIDITRSYIHNTVNKNPGFIGEPNSSIDILDKNNNVSTIRWYDKDGKAYRDVDMTDHGNPKMYPEVPHEHKWEWDGNRPNRK